MRSFFIDIRRMMIEADLPRLIGALAVLIIGWIIAGWLAGKAAGIAGKCLEFHRKHMVDREEHTGMISGTVKLVSRIVFWLIMILAILGSMSLLHLEYAAVPLREFVTSVVQYIPNIAGALILLFLAKILADFSRSAVRRVLEKKDSGRQLTGKLKISAEKSAANGSTAAYFLVWLFFLPAILNALNIYGITAPLQAMFETALIFLPRAVAALVIMIAGLWAAGVIRRAVSSLTAISHIDHLGKWCGLQEISGESLAGILGIVAWVLVAIPVITGALSALGIAELSNAMAGFLNILLNAAGNIIGAVLILLVSLAVAKVVMKGVEKLLKVPGVDLWWEKIGGNKGVFSGIPFSRSAGKIAFLAVMVLGVLAACEVLGLDALSEVVRRFALFGGNVILSMIVLLIGVVLADLASGIAGEQLGSWGRGIVKTAVIVFTAALALSNLQLGSGIVEIAFAMLVGAFCVAAALAFGFGGRDFASAILEKWKENCRK